MAHAYHLHSLHSDPAEGTAPLPGLPCAPPPTPGVSSAPAVGDAMGPKAAPQQPAPRGAGGDSPLFPSYQRLEAKDADQEEGGGGGGGGGMLAVVVVEDGGEKDDDDDATARAMALAEADARALEMEPVAPPPPARAKKVGGWAYRGRMGTRARTRPLDARDAHSRHLCPHAQPQLSLSVIACFSYLSMGGLMGLLGPAIPLMARALGVAETALGGAFAARAGGYILGSALVSRIPEK